MMKRDYVPNIRFRIEKIYPNFFIRWHHHVVFFLFTLSSLYCLFFLYLARFSFCMSWIIWSGYFALHAHRLNRMSTSTLLQVANACTFTDIKSEIGVIYYHLLCFMKKRKMRMLYSENALNSTHISLFTSFPRWWFLLHNRSFSWRIRGNPSFICTRPLRYIPYIQFTTCHFLSFHKLMT